MSGLKFFQTILGKRHYEHTMPELVRQLTRLNDLFERLVVQVELDRKQPEVGTTSAQVSRTESSP